MEEALWTASVPQGTLETVAGFPASLASMVRDYALYEPDDDTIVAILAQAVWLDVEAPLPALTNVAAVGQSALFVSHLRWDSLLRDNVRSLYIECGEEVFMREIPLEGFTLGYFVRSVKSVLPRQEDFLGCSLRTDGMKKIECYVRSIGAPRRLEDF